jgi:hypothetical protein
MRQLYPSSRAAADVAPATVGTPAAHPSHSPAERKTAAKLARPRKFELLTSAVGDFAQYPDQNTAVAASRPLGYGERGRP